MRFCCCGRSSHEFFLVIVLSYERVGHIVLWPFLLLVGEKLATRRGVRKAVALLADVWVVLPVAFAEGAREQQIERKRGRREVGVSCRISRQGVEDLCDVIVQDASSRGAHNTTISEAHETGRNNTP